MSLEKFKMSSNLIWKEDSNKMRASNISGINNNPASASVPPITMTTVCKGTAFAYLQCHFHSVKRRNGFFGNIVKTPIQLYVLPIRCCFDCKLAFSTDHSLNKRIIIMINWVDIENCISTFRNVYKDWYTRLGYIRADSLRPFIFFLYYCCHYHHYRHYH